jgi:hypothetical protein
MPKARKKSPTARSLEELRALGATVAVVEQTVPRTFIKRDFLGFADLIAVFPGAMVNGCHKYGKIVAIQVTSASNHSARLKKIAAEPRAKDWITAGGMIELHSWKKVAGRWVSRKEEIVLEDLEVTHA